MKNKRVEKNTENKKFSAPFKLRKLEGKKKRVDRKGRESFLKEQ